MDRTDNQLRACVKALNDVIGPAMDSADAQAAEQLYLVADYLEYLRARLDYLYERDRFEVRHYKAMGEAILEDSITCSPTEADILQGAIKSAEEAYGQPGTWSPVLKGVAAELASAIKTVIRDAAGSEEKPRTRIESTVLAMTQEKIDADRAWHLPQGFDPDPASALSIDEALGLAAAPA